jgi:hypothetical protein
MYKKIKSITDRINISHVILIWLVVNLLSAAFTLLYTDESYYTLWAQNLAFGYFDHPPVVALFIRLGSVITGNEAGVRLVSVLAISTALFFTYRLSDAQKPLLFMAAIFSVFALNLLGFMALPDAPLLLFTSLFFVAYRRFLLKGNTINTVLLALVMAGILYSKYHGILVILFTLISNIKLLRSGKFWFAVILGVLFFIPHLLWQYDNGFVTFSYHLFERSASIYRISFTIEYIIGQILFYGPFTALFMYVALIKFRGHDKFDKALVWNIWGITGFFLLSSFRGRVEVNWTLPVLIPLLIIFMKYGYTNPGLRREFYYFAVPSIILIILFRIQMIYPVFKLKISRIDDLRIQKEFVHEVISDSRGLPIICSSYQKAGIISYYSGIFVPSINLNGRRNQFSLWHAEDSLLYRKVAYVNNYLNEGVKIQDPFYGDYKVSIIDSLPVMNEIVVTAEPRKIMVGFNEYFDIKVILKTKKPYNNFRDAGVYRTRLCAELYKKDSLVCEKVCPVSVDQLLKKNNGEYSFSFISPGEKGFYDILIALKTSELGIWSTRKEVRVKVK